MLVTWFILTPIPFPYVWFFRFSSPLKHVPHCLFDDKHCFESPLKQRPLCNTCGCNIFRFNGGEGDDRLAFSYAMQLQHLQK